MRLACIDIGTNTVLLLVADVGDQGILLPIVDRLAIARLGEGVDQHRRLSEPAMQRALAVIKDHQALIASLDVDRTLITATSAVRDAANREEFASLITDNTGYALEILDGNEEALRTWRGAVSGFPLADSDATAVLDIGGGSTELTIGRGHSLVDRRSVDLGSVRLTERYLFNHPPTPSAIKQCREDLRAQLWALPNFEPSTTRLIGVAGTVTTLAMLELALPSFDARKIAGWSLTTEQVERWLLRMESMTHEALHREFHIEPGRADIILAGVLILHEFLLHSKAPAIQVSERGLRYGILEREVQRLGRTHPIDHSTQY